MKLWPGKKLLEPGGLYRRVCDTQMAQGLEKKNGFPGLRLDHRQSNMRRRQLQRDGGRPAARPDVNDAGHACRKMLSGDQWLDK